jgi:hypothetical protein
MVPAGNTVFSLKITNIPGGLNFVEGILLKTNVSFLTSNWKR